MVPLPHPEADVMVVEAAENVTDVGEAVVAESKFFVNDSKQFSFHGAAQQIFCDINK